MQPLRITARMQSGVVVTPGDGLPLDAILDHAWCRRKLGPALYEPGAPHVKPDELPLKRIVYGGWHGAWLWAASFAELEGARYRQWWHKKTHPDGVDGVQVEMTARKLNLTSGRYKELRVALPTVWAPEIVWYAVGDSEGLANLLAYAPAIGKKVSQGNGWVAEWVVEPWPADWSLLRDGVATRSLPLPLARQLGAAGDELVMGYRPPYYVRTHQERCIVPPASGG